MDIKGTFRDHSRDNALNFHMCADNATKIDTFQISWNFLPIPGWLKLFKFVNFLIGCNLAEIFAKISPKWINAKFSRVFHMCADNATKIDTFQILWNFPIPGTTICDCSIHGQSRVRSYCYGQICYWVI